MTAPMFGARPCPACHGEKSIRGIEGPCARCHGDGFINPETPPEPASDGNDDSDPREAVATDYGPPPDPRDHDPDGRRHDSKTYLAARILYDDGWLRNIEAIYDWRCSCGHVRRDTRAPAKVYELKRRYGWDILTHYNGKTNANGDKVLADYELITSGRWPKP